MTEKPAIAIDEFELAGLLGMSVSFLRKDRTTKRLIPYYKLGDSVRYDITRVRQALAGLEKGGAQKKTREKIHTGIATAQAGI